jgi:hypothetical protein
MKKLTLLEIVQDILSDMDSDEVNSITDTTESLQVAQVVRTTYSHIIDGRDWPHLYTLFQITGWSDGDKPTHLTIPEDVVEVMWLKYDKKEVAYKSPESFLQLVDVRDPALTTVDTVVDVSGVSLYILNDRAPSYWTSFDEKTIIFDSYDSAVENTIVTAKTQAYGKRLPVFTMEDSFVPDLPAQAFSYLLAESKAHASMSLRQAQDGKAEQYSLTQRRRMSQEAWKVQGGVTIPNYGRKR